MTRLRLQLWTAVLILIGALGLSACRSAEKNTVTFSVFGDAAELAAYEALVAAFAAEHPEIDVRLGHIPGDAEYRQRLAAGFSSGEPPDIFLLNYRRVAPFAAEGALAPLTDYLAASEVIAAADFFPEVIDAFTINGRLWCLPQNVSSLVVYYNRDLFEAAGVPLPTAGWTRDDFVAAARALTRDLDGDGRSDQYGAGVQPSLYRLAPFLWQEGGELVDDPVNPTRLTLDTPEAQRALQWLVDLQVKERVAPDRAAVAAERIEARFLNGTLGMFFSSRRSVPTFRTITQFTWDVAPLPRGAVEVGILHSDAYCMAAATKNKDAAWTFIEFANSEQGQRIVAASGRTVPSLRRVAESDAFLTPDLPPANSRVFLETIPVLRAVPRLPGWIAVEEAADKEIERAFYGEISTSEAASTADRLTREYFGR